MRARAATFVALLLCGGDLAAQDYSVRTFVQPETGITDTRPFQFVIQIDGQSGPRVVPPQLPKIDGLTLISGPNSNRRFFWRNGRATAMYQIVYQLLAESPGTVEIPSLQVQIDDKSYRTEPVRIEIDRGSDGSRGVTPRRSVAPRRERADAVFLEVELGAEEVWVGQPVPLTLTLFSARTVSDLQWRSQPAFSNFWVESLEVNPEAEAYRKRIGEQVYTAYPIDRRVLVPPSPGEFVIEPYTVQMLGRVPGNDVFDIFSFGRAETIVRKTPELKLKVKQLPPGQPPGFGGAVGRYSLSAKLDRDRAAVNDAVALRATVDGRGSLQAVAAPLLNAPPDVKVFEPKVTESTRRAADGMRSRKTWEWLLVPLKPGELRLPELRFPFFDPESGTYQVASSDPLLLAVDKSDRLADTAVARGEIRVQQRDLAYIKPLHGELSARGARAHETQLFRVLVLAPLALTPLSIWLGRRRARLRQDRGLSRARRARARARKRLRAAQRKLQQADAAAFHEEVARTLVEYVADRFDRSASGMTYDAADELLLGQGVDAALRRRFRACLETCDFARFVPSAAKAERRTEVLGEATRLIEELERAR